jgi:choline dehydrogenase-like flavoprotein
MTHQSTHPTYDAIVIGSGFGGSMVAHSLVHAGLKVLMLERGDWVPRSLQNWDPNGTVFLTPFYTDETPYRVLTGGTSDVMGAYSCVGGPSVFYGGVSMRFREADFEAAPEIVGNSEARWPFSYADLEPYYTHAEQILDVAGETGRDPTEPNRSASYPQALNALSYTSRLIEQAARDLRLNPFRLALAINYSPDGNRARCISCTTCDTFACAIQAKNDLATCVLPDLIRKGLHLKPNVVVTRLVSDGNRLVSLECHDKQTDEKHHYHAQFFVLSAGALGSPHLLLASELHRVNPGGHTIGRYLMRHCSAIVFGFFPCRPNKAEQFHKQIGIHDFYFGHPTIKTPPGKLGSIQQLQTPPVGLVKEALPKPLGRILSAGVEHLTGLLVMAEDKPQYNNHVTINRRRKDRFGLPQLLVTHHYSRRDNAARDALIRSAKQIFRKAGAWFCYVHQIKTFSHAVGTVRMGDAAHASALGPYCQFRGVRNLYVVDGSFMPTSAGLNPSLTIAANALRVGEHIAGIFREKT